ncbi:hypothetical protein PybrP1_003558 [[Pythium] brassicae (nom. inval.)]|nr:hypothetical protein PybrP1_003558 [[Pythium] brassicae (nom. inval.)]
MQRASRGTAAPKGTAGQEAAAMKYFGDFLQHVGMQESALDEMNLALVAAGPAPSQNLYSLLTAFSIYLQSKPNVRSGELLAKATAVGYMSQVTNMLQERFPTHLQDNKRIAKISDKMAGAIAERNLLANMHTRDAPGCKLEDLVVLMQELAIGGVGGGYKSVHDVAVLTLLWHTIGRAIDTCFARKSQLSIATSG